MAIMKGVTPLYMSHTNSCVMLPTRKTVTATGGIITPIINVTPMIIPNQIGSNPSFMIVG